MIQCRGREGPGPSATWFHLVLREVLPKSPLGHRGKGEISGLLLVVHSLILSSLGASVPSLASHTLQRHGLGTG